MGKRQRPSRPPRSSNRRRHWSFYRRPRQLPCRPSPIWEAFADQYHTHPGFDEETLYALPLGLVAQLNSLHVFSKEELEFEEKLAQVSGAGFFLQHPFAYLSLEPPNTEQEEELQQESRVQRVNWNASLIEEFLNQGATDLQVEQMLEALNFEDDGITDLRQGYLGWLVTHPEFRQERDEYCERWKPRIQQDRRFWSFPRSWWGERPGIRRCDRQYYHDTKTLYDTWGLERLVTFELPTLMAPQLDRPNFYLLDEIYQAGLVLFLPWYLLRKQTLELGELIQRTRQRQLSHVLAGWIDGEEKNWGPKQYSHMLRIYIYWELALQKRYSNRVKVAEFDSAYSMFSQTDDAHAAIAEDTIRKIRQQMNQRLRAAEE